MAHSYEQIASWLDAYFRGVNANTGSLESAQGLSRYFSEDLEFQMYTAAGSELMSSALGREELLMSFVHPGLLESITPNYYVIDVSEMKAVVQFAIVFRDQKSGKEWPVKQASAHYQLESDSSGGLQIAKIQYWTELFTEEFGPMFEQWERSRAEALSESGRSAHAL